MHSAAYPIYSSAFALHPKYFRTIYFIIALTFTIRSLTAIIFLIKNTNQLVDTLVV